MGKAAATTQQAQSNGSTDEEILAVADAVSQVSDYLKSGQAIVQQTADKNDALQIDWNNIPAHLLDSNGNLQGTPFSPADISNALGGMAQFQNYWDGQAVTTGNYGAVFEKLARVLTVLPTNRQPRPQV